jgi:hypothetical protein
MSDALKLQLPLGGLLRKSKLKGITSVVSSFQALNNDKTVLKKIDNAEKDQILDNIQVIANRFTTMKRLGSGGFGEVYLAKDKNQNDLLIAIKFERSDTHRPQLPIEKNVFQIIMGLLGPSVEDLLNFCGRKFSLKTISMIIEQTLRGIETLHNHSLIHRDLKPDSKNKNFNSNLS